MDLHAKHFWSKSKNDTALQRTLYKSMISELTEDMQLIRKKYSISIHLNMQTSPSYKTSPKAF